MNDKEGHMDNTKGKMVPNYSKVPAINRVYNSREAVVRGSGITDADVQFVEELIAGGQKSEVLCARFDTYQKSETRKDSVSLTRAIKRALDDTRTNIARAAETREDMARNPEKYRQDKLREMHMNE